MELDEEEHLHDWQLQDNSFDHEYGCEQIYYWECTICGETKGLEPGDLSIFNFEYILSIIFSIHISLSVTFLSIHIISKLILHLL